MTAGPPQKGAAVAASVGERLAVIPGNNVEAGALGRVAEAVDVGSPSDAPRGWFQALQARAPAASRMTRSSPPMTDKIMRVLFKRVSNRGK